MPRISKHFKRTSISISASHVEKGKQWHRLEMAGNHLPSP